MRVSVKLLVVSGAVFAAIAAGLLWQYRTQAELAADLMTLRAQRSEAEQLRQENRRLAAATMAEPELATLRAEHEAAVRLRGELEALRRKADEAVRAAAVKAPAAEAKSVRTLADATLFASEWRDAGRATPVAALETVLWSAAGGRLDTLAGGLVFATGAKEKAEIFFAALPEGMRREMGSAEKLIARLTAQQLPLGGVKVLSETAGPEGVTLETRIGVVTGETRTARLTLRQEGEAWKLVVPMEAIDGFAAKLGALASGAGGG